MSHRTGPYEAVRDGYGDEDRAAHARLFAPAHALVQEKIRYLKKRLQFLK